MGARTTRVSHARSSGGRQSSWGRAALPTALVSGGGQPRRGKALSGNAASRRHRPRSQLERSQWSWLAGRPQDEKACAESSPWHPLPPHGAPLSIYSCEVGGTAAHGEVPRRKTAGKALVVHGASSLHHVLDGSVRTAATAPSPSVRAGVV